MAVLKPKNRVVVFRISEDDYRKIQKVSGQLGARSLSEFARSVVLRTAHAGEAEPQTLASLAERVGALEQKIERLGRSKED